MRFFGTLHWLGPIKSKVVWLQSPFYQRLMPLVAVLQREEEKTLALLRSFYQPPNNVHLPLMTPASVAADNDAAKVPPPTRSRPPPAPTCGMLRMALAPREQKIKHCSNPTWRTPPAQGEAPQHTQSRNGPQKPVSSPTTHARPVRTHDQRDYKQVASQTGSIISLVLPLPSYLLAHVARTLVRRSAVRVIPDT